MTQYNFEWDIEKAKLNMKKHDVSFDEAAAPRCKMRIEYDFSRGVRGKYYKPDIKINLPVYLDSEVLDFVQRIAKKRKTDISSVVNNLIKNDIQLIENAK
jgi:hypothetical protein